MSFKEYLESLMKTPGIDIAQRKFDSKYNVWQKVFELSKDGSYSEYWQVVGVANTYREATNLAQKFQRIR